MKISARSLRLKNTMHSPVMAGVFHRRAPRPRAQLFTDQHIVVNPPVCYLILLAFAGVVTWADSFAPFLGLGLGLALKKKKKKNPIRLSSLIEGGIIMYAHICVVR